MKSLLIFLKNYWFALLLLFTGLHIAFFQIFGYDLRNIIGDLGDSRFIISIVEYNYQWLAGNYKDYWNGFFMYPDKDVISYSDNLLGITPFYAMFRVTGMNYLTAFQLLILLCHILNFFAANYAFTKLVNNRYAAAAGAFIFAFSLALNNVHNHPQFTFRFFIPLFFLFLHNYLHQQKLKSLILAFIFLVLQFYLGVYLGYFTLFFGGIYFLCYHAANYRLMNMSVIKKTFLHGAIAGTGALLVLLPMFYMYYERNKTSGYYTDFSQILETIPEPSSYIKAFDSSVMWKPLVATPVLSKFSWFHTLFPGILVFAALFFSIFLIGKGYKKSFFVTLLSLVTVIFILTTNFNGNTLYDNLFHIPGFKAIRVVSRLMLVFIFFLAWIVCENLNYFSGKSKRAEITLIVLLPVILFFDNYCKSFAFKTFGKEETAQRTGSIRSKIVSNPNYSSYEAFAWIPSTHEEAFKVQIDAMLTAVELKMKTINGYSSSCHGKFGPVWNNHDSLSVVTWAKEMNLDPNKILLVK